MHPVIQNEIEEFVDLVKKCFGRSLKKVILCGSYARGDYDEASDIDVMVLVSLPDEVIRQNENRIYDEAFELELKYGKVLSPIIRNQEFYEYWSDTLPFYRNGRGGDRLTEKPDTGCEIPRKQV